MAQDERNILDLLRTELEFLKEGGYGRSQREPWKARLIFEDSPSCMNYERRDSPSPCGECALIQFVPPEKRGDKYPCRHIPLRPDGETLFGFELYRGASQQEMEADLEDWLRSTIARLEAEKAPT